MASVQANPDMAGQGQMPGNITREQIQQVYSVCVCVHHSLRPGQLHPIPTFTDYAYRDTSR